MSDLSEGQDQMMQLDERVRELSRLERVRELSRLLAALGWDITLHKLGEEIPDARDRLGYVARMTDAAATQVLNLVDEGQPRCEAASSEAIEISARLAQLSTHAELGVGEARAALAEAAAALAYQSEEHGHQAALLSRIMLAQDFQDLSGQVIKKVVVILDHAEHQLCQLLAQSEGPKASTAASAKLEGPQVPDKAVAQEEVDDFLASLGF